MEQQCCDIYDELASQWRQVTQAFTVKRKELLTTALEQLERRIGHLWPERFHLAIKTLQFNNREIFDQPTLPSEYQFAQMGTILHVLEQANLQLQHTGNPDGEVFISYVYDDPIWSLRCIVELDGGSILIDIDKHFIWIEVDQRHMKKYKTVEEAVHRVHEVLIDTFQVPVKET